MLIVNTKMNFLKNALYVILMSGTLWPSFYSSLYKPWKYIWLFLFPSLSNWGSITNSSFTQNAHWDPWQSDFIVFNHNYPLQAKIILGIKIKDIFIVYQIRKEIYVWCLKIFKCPILSHLLSVNSFILVWQKRRNMYNYTFSWLSINYNLCAVFLFVLSSLFTELHVKLFHVCVWSPTQF